MDTFEKKYNEALERARQIKNGEGEWRYSDLAEIGPALTDIFPELRESEDERIRKAIIAFIKNRLDDGNAPEYLNNWIAWLEKQKEQKPEFPKPHKGDDTNPYDMSVSEAQEYAINRGFGIPFNDGEVYVDERHLTQTIGNILRWADEHPKEQKPAEKRDYSGLTDLERAIHRGFLCDGVENVPVTIIKETAKECLKLIDNYRPVEWSEEDENIIKDLMWICDGLEQGYNEFFHKKEKYAEIRNFLKSLRPQKKWKPSEEQIEALKDAKMRMSLEGWGLCPLLQSLINELESL